MHLSRDLCERVEAQVALVFLAHHGWHSVAIRAGPGSVVAGRAAAC